MRIARDAFRVAGRWSKKVLVRWFSLGNALLHCGWQLSTSNHH